MTSHFASSYLATEEPSSLLDLDDWIGQRSATFRFDLVDAITGYRQQVHPVIDMGIPTISHDTGRTIKRILSGFFLNKDDTALLTVISARIEPFMILGGETYALGQYMYNDETRLEFSSGDQSAGSLYDNMFIVDQEIEQSIPFRGDFIGALPVMDIIRDTLETVPVVYTLEPSAQETVGTWTIGTARGYVLEQLSVDGDYFSPWFDHTNVMRFIRSFDPAAAVPRFDFDTGNKVMADPVPTRSNDLLFAPNRFVVISNATLDGSAAVGTYDIPASAPHSFANRGFVVPSHETRQVKDAVDAQVIAENLGRRQTIFERAEVYTAPDPRHDSYDVIRWRGDNWLELAWTLPCIEGARMSHVMRKAYL